MTCFPPPGNSTSSTSRTKPRPSYEACRTSGGTIRHERSSCVPTQRTSRKFSAPSRPSTDHPALLSTLCCQPTTRHWRRRAPQTRGGEKIQHCPSSVSNDALDQMPQRHDDSLDLPSTLAKGIKPSTRPTRARPQEVYKATVLVALETFHSIITCIWEKEAIPLEFWGAIVISLYNNKCSKSDFGSYRRISRLCINKKILARIFLNRLDRVSLKKEPARGTV